MSIVNIKTYMMCMEFGSPFYESEVTGWNPEFAGRDPIAGYECSNCNEEATLDCDNEFVLSKFCPNCGARMDLEVL